MASGTMGRGHLRASDAVREQLIDTLKDAFALGQLTRDELDARAARALTSRTCAELAAIAVDIPALLTQAQPRPQPARKPVHMKAAACGAGLIIAPPSLWAVFLTYYGGFIVLLLAVFAGLAVPCRRRLRAGDDPIAGGRQVRGERPAMRAAHPADHTRWRHADPGALAALPQPHPPNRFVCAPSYP